MFYCALLNISSRAPSPFLDPNPDPTDFLSSASVSLNIKMKKDNTRYVRALERKVIQLSRILLRTRKDADVSAIEYSELHQEVGELRQTNDQIQ